MGKALFLSYAGGDNATLTCATELATLPATNLQKVQPSRVMRTSVKSPTIVIQLNPPVPLVTAVSLVAHNASSSATWRIRGATTQVNLTASPSVDTGSISMWPASGKPDSDHSLGFPYLSSLAYFTNNSFYAWWQIDISDASNSANFEAGRLFIGKALRPTINMANNIGIQPFTVGDQRYSDFNQITTDDRGVNGRRMLLPFAAIDPVDFRQYIFPFSMKHGKTKDFFFTFDPDAQQEFLIYSMQAVFEDTTAYERQRAFGATGARWAGGMSLRECT